MGCQHSVAENSDPPNPMKEEEVRAPISASPARGPSPQPRRRASPLASDGRPLRLSLSVQSALDEHDAAGSMAGGSRSVSPKAPLEHGAGIKRSVSLQIRQDNYVQAVETRLLRLCPLGRGSSSSVYKAVDLNTLRLVAVKEVRVGDNPKQKAQALEEMEAFATQRTPLLSNEFHSSEKICPYILRYYGSSYDEAKQIFAIAVEYEGGGSLADWCMERLPAPEPWLAHVGYCVLKALAFIHERGRIHRDIKPGNLMVGVNGGMRERDDSFMSARCGGGGGGSSSADSPMRQPQQRFVPLNPSAAAASSVGVGGPAALSPFRRSFLGFGGKMGGAPAGSDGYAVSSSSWRLLSASGPNADSSGTSPSISPQRLRSRPRNNSLLARRVETLSVSLADFGIAKSVNEADSVESDYRSRSAPQSPAGTRRFMAPERLRMENYGFASDVWSLGLTLATVFNNGKCPIPHAKNEFDQLSHAENLERFIAARGKQQPHGAAAAGGGGGGDGDAAAGAPLPDFKLPSPELTDFLLCCLRANPEQRPDALSLLGHPFLLHRFGWEQRCPEVLAAADARRRVRAVERTAEDVVRSIVIARLHYGYYTPVMDDSAANAGISELSYDLDVPERELKSLFRKVTSELAVKPLPPLGVGVALVRSFSGGGEQLPGGFGGYEDDQEALVLSPTFSLAEDPTYPPPDLELSAGHFSGPSTLE